MLIHEMISQHDDGSRNHLDIKARKWLQHGAHDLFLVIARRACTATTMSEN